MPHGVTCTSTHLAENMVLSSGQGVLRDAERREQLPAATDAGLPEYRLHVILNSVARDEEALGDRVRVQAGEYGTGDLALASGEPVSAAQEVECLSGSRISQSDGDLSLTVALQGRSFDHHPSPVDGALERVNSVRCVACSSYELVEVEQVLIETEHVGDRGCQRVARTLADAAGEGIDAKLGALLR